MMKLDSEGQGRKRLVILNGLKNLNVSLLWFLIAFNTDKLKIGKIGIKNQTKFQN